jgi:hypothetical protein
MGTQEKALNIAWKEQKDMSADLPCLGLHPRDITVIDQAVKGYLAYLRNAVPPSSTRDTRIRVLQNVRLRLAAVPQGQATEMHLSLTVADILALQVALEGFVRLVRQMVPLLKSVMTSFTSWR